MKDKNLVIDNKYLQAMYEKDFLLATTEAERKFITPKSPASSN